MISAYCDGLPDPRLTDRSPRRGPGRPGSNRPAGTSASNDCDNITEMFVSFVVDGFYYDKKVSFERLFDGK